MRIHLFLSSMACLAMLMSGMQEAEAVNPPTPPNFYWNLTDLDQAPTTYTAAGFVNHGASVPLFYQGKPYKNNETRVFAYMGIPSHPAGMKVPGMVLVHGGGGTAFYDWVNLWVAKGYAAIAMDCNGTTAVSEWAYGDRHQWAGPAEYPSYGFDTLNEPIGDQWYYHAIADIILANSLLRANANIDSDKIGLTGISWGGFLTCIAAGVDKRFKFAIPVYGCGYIYEDSAWAPTGKEISAQWMTMWDPSQFIPSIGIPTLWINGSNEANYFLDSHRKSYRLDPAEKNLLINIRMNHSHQDGWAPPEIYIYADSKVKGALAVPHVGVPWHAAGTAHVSYTSVSPIASAILAYTKSLGPWKDRLWASMTATVDAANHKVNAALPTGTEAYYFILQDQRGMRVSTEYIEKDEITAQSKAKGWELLK